VSDFVLDASLGLQWFLEDEENRKYQFDFLEWPKHLYPLLRGTRKSQAPISRHFLRPILLRGTDSELLVDRVDQTRRCSRFVPVGTLKVRHRLEKCQLYGPL
jgi:hypothetical protein